MQDDPQFTRSDTLNWLAVRYVSGELEESENREFEQRLADDQAACEAVASAVRTTLAVQAAFETQPLEAPRQTDAQVGVSSREQVRISEPPQHVRWISLTVAAAAVMAVLITPGFRGGRSGGPADTRRQNRDLAVLWTQTGEVLPEIGDQSESSLIEDARRRPADTPEDQLHPADLEDLPAWLLVALEAQHVQDGDMDNVLEN